MSASGHLTASLNPGGSGGHYAQDDAVHKTIPAIVEHIPVSIDCREREKLTRLAESLLAAEPTLSATHAFTPEVATGLVEGPSLLLQDLSGMALVADPEDLYLQYRILLLADEADLIAIGVRRSPAFEDYCRDILKLGQVKIVSPAQTRPPKSLAVRCRQDENVMAKAIQLARLSGRLSVKPYMGTGAVWALARDIAVRSGAKVWVAAPPPHLTQRVNDKVWFTRCVAEILGQRAVPPSSGAYGAAALAGRVAAMAKRFNQVGIKVPNSSSALGNIVLESARLRPLPIRAVQARLLSLLHQLGWHNTYPLLVSVWECPVIVSPSVQLWIPEQEQGLPVVEGVFNQVIQEPQGEFIGTVPSELPQPWLQRLACEAAQIGYVFQRLGYFGRCSFDAIIVGDQLDSAVLHWIECNGRWGGTSIPMTLANRLVGDWSTRSFIVVQRGRIHEPPRDFAAVLNRVQDHLFRPGQSTRGGVFLLPGRIETGTGLDYMVIADTLAAARVEVEAMNALLLNAHSAAGKKREVVV